MSPNKWHETIHTIYFMCEKKQKRKQLQQQVQLLISLPSLVIHHQHQQRGEKKKNAYSAHNDMCIGSTFDHPVLYFVMVDDIKLMLPICSTH